MKQDMETGEAQGRVWKYGDHINTDVIIPARHLSLSTAEDLARYCMEDLDESFAAEVRPGDVIVAGDNFGCGSSREHAPLAIKGAGVSCVVAVSFARIFYRNAINVGLPIIECPEAVASARSGHQVVVDLEVGQVRNLTTGEVHSAEPYPPFLMEIIQAGGLVPHTQRSMGSQA